MTSGATEAGKVTDQTRRGSRATRDTAILIYDGECPICQGWIRWVKRRALPGEFEFLPCQSPERRVRFHSMAEETCLEAIQLVLVGDGQVLSGDRAIRESLGRLRGWRWVAPILGLPGLRGFAPRLYRWVARNRYALSGALPRGSCQSSPEGGACVRHDS